MKLKSLVRPTRGLTTLVAVGTLTIGMTGFAAIAATTASADPSQVFTVVGSDTVQDIENQFALDEGANLIGSWNAVNPVSKVGGEIITPNNAAGGQCSFTRPNGSGQGENAFRKSINQSTAAAQLAVPPGPNCIDWSRSSAGPGSDQKADGQLVFVPFALDAVSGSVGTESSAAFQANTNTFTVANLTTLYSCGTVTVNGVTYDPNSPVGTGNTQIDLYVPQSGSGTLKFWAQTLNFSATTLPPCLHQTIVNAINPANNGTVVEEHDGSAVSDDPQGYGPFSIAQWIAQKNGHDDRRHLAILQNINGVFPCSNMTNCSTSGSINTAFPITREVYNIAQFAQVTGGSASITQLLGGSSSLLCRDVITILNYGFALLSSSTPDLCGATTANLRAFDSTDPV